MYARSADTPRFLKTIPIASKMLIGPSNPIFARYLSSVLFGFSDCKRGELRPELAVLEIGRIPPGERAMIGCTRMECQTTAGCAHRGPAWRDVLFPDLPAGLTSSSGLHLPSD